MKSILTTIALAILALGVHGQATFVTNMPGYADVTILTAAGEKIYTYDDTSLFLYNMDGTLYKTIMFPTETGYSVAGVYGVSDHLFNSDALVESGVLYLANSSTTFPQYQNILINETGAVLQHIDTAGGGSIHYDQGSDTYELLTYNFTGVYSTNLYNLPGSIPCGVCGALGSQRQSSTGQTMTVSAPYPNPSAGIVRILYNMGGNPNGMLVFYNMAGQRVKQVPVFSGSTAISINNSGFPAGNYTYNIVAGSSASNTETMVAQ